MECRNKEFLAWAKNSFTALLQSNRYLLRGCEATEILWNGGWRSTTDPACAGRFANPLDL